MRNKKRKVKKNYIGQITETLSILFLISKMLLKYIIMYLFHVGRVYYVSI